MGALQNLASVPKTCKDICADKVGSLRLAVLTYAVHQVSESSWD